MSYFIDVLVNEKRFPVYFVFDCIVTCFTIHSFFNFPNLLITAALGVLLPTFTDNLVSIFLRKKFAIIENPYLLLVSSLIFVIIEFTPNGQAFDILLKITPVIAVFAGLNAGRDVNQGVKIGEVKFFNSDFRWFAEFFFGVFCASGKYGILAVISQLTSNKFRSMVTIAGEVVIGSFIASFRRQIAKMLKIKTQTVEVIVIILVTCLNVGRTYMPDNHISVLFNKYF